ncbi:DUF1093 domain-containing protein [Lacticaseibacillus jixianensis]|uniref:DUF1093 domain-containing protein n=1 Tax=Lacticaseibacillus jixianensis TaxID=2486012 RepID=A0ABW4BCU2_9LACO|nr:DUF1093 domain-containing protein [Lacticaseibacillus jixianensis]
MKKIIGLIAAVVVVAIGVWGYSYYRSTYQTTTAYAKVTTVVKKKAVENGKDYKVNGQQYYYYDYDFTWVTKSGDTRQLGYETKQAPDGPMPLTVGQFVTAEISAKRVVKGPSPISKGSIPSSVLAQLN